MTFLGELSRRESWTPLDKKRYTSIMLIRLKVHPDSNKSAILKKSEDAYEVWVRAPAENGLANKEALETLAKTLGRAAKKLIIVKGSTSPNKIVKVYD